jgi:hypothetical protein
MKWYHYLACLLAGLFLTNAIPHFVNGISGDSFPSPFSNPPGKGLSSPLVNVVWGLGNFLVGYILLRTSKISRSNTWSILAFAVGVISMSIMLSLTFSERMR